MLYRRSTEMTIQHNEHMRDGKGTVVVKHLLNSDEMLGKGRLFAELTLPPGASIGMHRHEGSVEAYYILQGSGRYYNDDDEPIDVNVGDVTLVDDQHSHSIENTGNTPMVLIGLVLFSGDSK